MLKAKFKKNDLDEEDERRKKQELEFAEFISELKRFCLAEIVLSENSAKAKIMLSVNCAKQNCSNIKLRQAKEIALRKRNYTYQNQNKDKN